jgi:hypothetical protein
VLDDLRIRKNKANKVRFDDGFFNTNLLYFIILSVVVRFLLHMFWIHLSVMLLDQIKRFFACFRNRNKDLLVTIMAIMNSNIKNSMPNCYSTY